MENQSIKHSTAKLLDRNKQWAARAIEKDAEFFSRLVNQQKPTILWIGCSDSRVPANELVDLAPGEVFVHRNVANQVIHTDFNCLSVLQYAVEVLKVEHVIVTGHYGCGGVEAALQDARLGLLDNWLRHIQDTARKHHQVLDTLPYNQKYKRLCEFNVMEQVLNIAQTSILQEAWAKGQNISLHGWIYQVGDGLLKDLQITLNANEAMPVKKLLGWEHQKAQDILKLAQ